MAEGKFEAEYKQNGNTYRDVLNHRGEDTEHDLCGAAHPRSALFPDFRGRMNGNCRIA
jgi:hypothetical protein